jgi:hypothetical protein
MWPKWRLRAGIISTCKNQQPIGWQRKRSRMAELMQSLQLRGNIAAVSLHLCDAYVLSLPPVVLFVYQTNIFSKRN